MNEKKDNKVKAWFAEHKDDINYHLERIALYTFGVGIGYGMGKFMSTYKTELGLRAAHEMGFVKFFNPETTGEVDVFECVRLLEQKSKELKKR